MQVNIQTWFYEEFETKICQKRKSYKIFENHKKNIVHSLHFLDQYLRKKEYS